MHRSTDASRTAGTRRPVVATAVAAGLLATGFLPPAAARADDTTVLAPKEPLTAGKASTVDLVTPSIDTAELARIDQGAGEVKATLNANVAFDKDKAVLKPEAQSRLAEVVAQLRTQPPGAVSIKGYTDNLGTHEHGVELSQQRADAVRQVLAPQLSGFTLTAEGRAEADPVAPNDSETNRAKNRRVEIAYTRPPAPSARPSTATPSAAPQRTLDPGAGDRTTGRLEADGANGEHYSADVHPVVVTNGLASVRLTLTMTRDPKSVPAPSFLTAEDSITALKNSGAPTGIEMVDDQAKVRHLPATRPDGTNLCFAHPQDVLLRAHIKQANITCWYDPPRSPTVSIKVGSAGTVKDVAVVR